MAYPIYNNGFVTIFKPASIDKFHNVTLGTPIRINCQYVESTMFENLNFLSNVDYTRLILVSGNADITINDVVKTNYEDYNLSIINIHDYPSSLSTEIAQKLVVLK